MNEEPMEHWRSVVYEPPAFVQEDKPWWKFWRKPRTITTGFDGSGLFVAVDADGQRIMSSPDGVTWTSISGGT